MRLSQILTVGAIFIVLSGCATHREQNAQGMQYFEQGNYPAAIAAMEAQYEGKDNSELLKYMDVGITQYLAGNYQAAIKSLTQAEQIADELYTKTSADLLGSSLSPVTSPYRGQTFEVIYVNYYKALAYLKLGIADPTTRTLQFENARIETRKVDSLLGEISYEEGDYDDLKEKKESTFGRIMSLFSSLSGAGVDTDYIKYRDDAYIHYLNGVIYELNDELDNARIAYQKSAETYEKGFAKYYGIGKNMTEMAWSDTLRVMKLAGGYDAEYKALRKTKLSQAARERLDSLLAAESQLLVIQHLGVIPHRSQMNLAARINLITQQIDVDVVPIGTAKERKDQRAWFQALYSDKGEIDMLINYHQGGIFGLLASPYRMQLTLAPVWSVVTQIGLDDAMAGGIRLTIPYYPSTKAPYGESKLLINNQVSELIKAQSFFALAVNQQAVSASSDFNETLAREAVKSLVAEKTLGSFGMLGSLAGKVISGATSVAETRNWLTLPREIRITRLPVAVGEQKVILKTAGLNGQSYSYNEQLVTTQAGKITVLINRDIRASLESGSPINTASVK